MIPLRIEEIAAAIGGRVENVDPTTIVRDVTTDSRSVPAGGLFVALKGERHDGHDFVDEALDAGAVAVLVAKSPGSNGGTPGIVVADTWQALADLAGAVRGRVSPATVAVTGSVGKTTTKDFIAAALRGAGRRVTAAKGSFNNEIGVPLTCLDVEEDTDVLVLEVGSRGVGHIRRLMPLARPDVAVVTAVSGAHLEMFGDLDTVARAKAELVEALPPGGTAVLNADDPRVAAMADRAPAATVTFAVQGEADVRARDVRQDRLGRAAFRAMTPWANADVDLPVAGVHQVGNALAALATAGVLGVDVGLAADGIGEANVSSWRADVRELRDGVIVLNDAYNANPASMRAALDTLVSVDSTKTWAVLGYMAELGSTEAREHEDIGRYVVDRGVDRLVVVGEDAAPIADGAESAGLGAEALWRVRDASAAVEILRDRAAPGDAILVKASRVGGLEAVVDALAEGART